MPGNVPAATVADIFPVGIPYRSFSESRAWPVEQNNYAGGEHQARALTATSRKGPWSVACRCTGATFATLRAFWDAHLTTVPFLFTPIGEVQRAVRFASPWQQTSQMGLIEVTFTLIEIS